VRVLGPISGYSTQAKISLEVAELINNSRLRFWFATEFNPVDNDPRSNPLHIFDELDRAAKSKDDRSRKASSVADNLRAWVSIWDVKGLLPTGEAQAEALYAIKMAFEDGGFHPRVFYLSEVVGAITEAQPDEYRVENEPFAGPLARVLRILPP